MIHSIKTVFKPGLRSIFVLFFVALASAAAEAPDDAPSRGIKGTIDQVRLIVASSKGNVSEEDTDKQLKAIITPMFDFAEMSRRSLGAYWEQGSPEEQAEFIELFSDLLGKTYLKRIKRNAESSKIARMSDEIDGDKAMVRSTVDTEGEEVSLDYRMIRRTAGIWKVYDVIIENVGLVSNYRNEFPAIIRKEGFPGLLTRLRNKQIAQAAPHGD